MSKKYTLSIQEVVRQDTGKADLSYGVLKITSPDGEEHSFQFRSGGWGKGALPGLDGQDVNGGEGYAAVYGLNNSGALISKDGVKIKGGQDSYEYEKGKGFWIPLDTPSGLGRSGFGIHPDGGVDGTLGCIGLAKDECVRFQQLWTKLRGEGNLPESVVVLAPSADKVDIPAIAAKFGESANGFHRYERSDDVKAAQIQLNALLEANGKKGIKADGMFGPETARALIDSGLKNELAQTLGLDADKLVDLEKAATGNDHNFFRKLNSESSYAELASGFSKISASTEALAAAAGIKNIELDSGSAHLAAGKKEVRSLV